MTRNSIFTNNSIPHNLDLMHIEKNIYNKIIKIFWILKKKIKDNMNDRLDLKKMGIRKKFHSTQKDER